MNRPRRPASARTSSAAARSGAAPASERADPAPALFEALDEDTICYIFRHCSGKSMAHAGATCSRFRQLAGTAALLVLQARRPNLLPPLGLQHNWLRALGTDEALVQQLGQTRSASCSWRDEYVTLQTEDFRLYQLLTGEGWSEEHLAFSRDFFGDGGERSIQACLLANAGDIDWRVCVAGWTRGHAEALTLLMTSGAAMSRSLTRIRTFAGRPRGRPAVCLGRALSFPASVLAVSDALAAAAYRHLGQQPPPHLYSPLTLPAEAWDSGPGCLLEEDGAWAALLRSKVKIGATLRTSAFVNAEEASRHALGSGAGFLIQDDDDERPVHAIEVVRFVNRRADASGMHSLVQDAPGEGLRSRCGPGYTLPPFSTVRLEAIDEPGQWRVLGKPVQARLFTCSVTYAL